MKKLFGWSTSNELCLKRIVERDKISSEEAKRRLDCQIEQPGNDIENNIINVVIDTTMHGVDSLKEEAASIFKYLKAK